MRPVVGRDWGGISVAYNAALQLDATPPAKLAFLLAADRWTLDTAVQPYAGCAHLFRGGETGLTTRHFRLSVAAGANHARYHCAVGFNTTAGTAANIAATTAQGGTAGNNPTKINVPTSFVRTFNAHQIADWNQLSLLSGDWIDDAPSANIDRQLELEQLAHPKVEPGSIAYVCGFSVVTSRQVEDLESL